MRPAYLGKAGPAPRREAAIDRLAALAAPIASRLPPFPGSVLLAAGLNFAFGNRQPEELEPLCGRQVALRIRDLGMQFDLAVTRRGFVACGRGGHPAVTISAGLGDFLRLARRRVDPDTLFFARRLAIEGDTERGLLLKNRLDAVDWSALAKEPPRPADLLAALAGALSRSSSEQRASASRNPESAT